MARRKHNPTDLHQLVLDGLDVAGDEGRLTEVALDSGVPYNTICKLRQRRHPNPGVETCIKLYEAMYG